MRLFALLAAALVLATAPIVSAPAAYADGIERPQRPRSPRRAPPPPLLGAPAPVQEARVESNIVTLPESFFVGGGGVGAHMDGGSYSSTTVVIRGGRATAVAFASASARAGVGVRSGGFGGGHRGGGCGCR